MNFCVLPLTLTHKYLNSKSKVALLCPWVQWSCHQRKVSVWYCRTRKAHGIVSVEVQGLREWPIFLVPVWVHAQEHGRHTFLFNDGHAEREQTLPHSSLCYSAFWWIGWDPSMVGKAMIHMLISSQNNLRDTSRIMFNQISGHSVAQSSWHIKLTITEGMLLYPVKFLSLRFIVFLHNIQPKFCLACCSKKFKLNNGQHPFWKSHSSFGFLRPRVLNRLNLI